MSKRELSPVAKELIAAKKRIENEVDWCPEGTGCCGYDPDTGAMCAIVALSNYIDNELLLDDAIAALILAAGGLYANAIIETNALGHAAVMRMYDHAIATEIQKANSQPQARCRKYYASLMASLRTENAESWSWLMQRRT